ncbi:MAG: hypothetical protein MOGMAGMI_02100 [Candidatus Omnitrophica bacterium]|nr:hypothetical protein [Candidatus Omnitrophota bacterium]
MSKISLIQRLTALGALTTLLLWVLPLGAFIKPSQEKTACGGKRAFHMCSMTSAQVSAADRPAGLVSYSSASQDVQKSARSSGSSSDELLVDTIIEVSDLMRARSYLKDLHPPASAAILLRDPIPKA